MSEIKVGDLVMVVRGMVCCGAATKMMGRVFVVDQIKLGPAGRCLHCGCLNPEALSARAPGIRPIRLPRLIRIDPLTDPESIEQHDEIPA